MNAALYKIIQEYSPRVMHNGEYRMMCPYRENHIIGKGVGDGSKSFFINPEKNVFTCFSCGASGNLMRLLTTKLGMSFSDAIEVVTLENVPLEYEPYEDYESIEEVRLPEFQPPHIIDFSRQPRKYIRRGFSREVLRHFKVGESIVNGVRTMTVPMFQGRVLVGVKYQIDSSEGRNFWYSEGFNKRKFLYNDHDCKEAIVVEGESDTWRSCMNDRPNTKATLGTSVSDWQIDRLAESERVIIAHDNDLPGIRSKEKLYHRLKHRTEVLFAQYEADDPGSSDYEDWNIAINNPVDYGVYSLEMIDKMGWEYHKIQNEIRKKYC